MKTILVTGVNGFVGQHLARELSGKGYNVVGLGGPGGAEQMSGVVASYYFIDLLDASAVKTVDFRNIDGIIHLAGLAAVGPSFDEPLKYMNANVGMQINLLEAARAQNVTPKSIVISSSSLYDPKTELPINEASPVLPNSPYAVSKMAQEQLALYYRTRGFEVVIARPFNHIGPGQNEGFIVPDLAKQVVSVERGEAKDIKVGNLDAKRDYSDVRDIATAYRLLFEKGKDGEIYNICSGTSRSGNEVLDGLLSSSKLKPEIIEDPARMRPSDTPDNYGDCGKLKQDTGWKSAFTFEQSLVDALEDWRSR